MDADEGRNAPGGNRTPCFFSFRETNYSVKEVDTAVVNPEGFGVGVDLKSLGQGERQGG